MFHSTVGFHSFIWVNVIELTDSLLWSEAFICYAYFTTFWTFFPFIALASFLHSLSLVIVLCTIYVYLLLSPYILPDFGFILSPWQAFSIHFL